MNKIFSHPKRAFWEALLLALFVFGAGLLLGVSLENSRLDKITGYYALSEISLFDTFALSNAITSTDMTCAELSDLAIDFADRIYKEARLLERYDGAGELTDDLLLAHKKYDLLRTFLWMDVAKIREKCPNNFTSIVYLYNYNAEDLTERATQIVWARILFDLKQEHGNKIILIPIAVNFDIASLNALVNNKNITKYPAVVINDKEIIYEFASAEDLKKYLGQKN